MDDVGKSSLHCLLQSNNSNNVPETLCTVNLATIYYRPRSEGDNALGSVRPSVCLFVLSWLNCLTYKSHYQFKVFVCVSVISGRMRKITQMRSIGVLISLFLGQSNQITEDKQGKLDFLFSLWQKQRTERNQVKYEWSQMLGPFPQKCSGNRERTILAWFMLQFSFSQVLGLNVLTPGPYHNCFEWCICLLSLIKM